MPENSESDGHSVCRPTPSGAKCVSETSHSGQKIPSVTAVKSVNSTKDGSIGSVQKLERFDNHVGNVLKSVVQTDPARLAALAAQNGKTGCRLLC